MSACTQGVVIGDVPLPLPLLLAICTLLGVCIPLLFNRFILSRKDRNDDDQKRFENTKDLLADGVAKASAFQTAIGKALKRPKPSMDDVLTVMSAGEVYFATLKLMAQAVLDGRVSDNTRTHDFVPKIAEALEKSVPAYYEALRKVCAKVGLPFEGEFLEGNYESLFRVLDMYDREAWAKARQRIGTGS